MATNNFPRKIADKYMENLKQAIGENEHKYGPKFVSIILSCVALVYNFYFIRNSRFTKIIRH